MDTDNPTKLKNQVIEIRKNRLVPERQSQPRGIRQQLRPTELEG